MPLYEGHSLITDKNITVVIDFGNYLTKVGFAGDTGPRAIVRSVVYDQTTGITKPIFEYGDEEELRHNLILFIQKLYFKNLLVNPKERRVVIVENLLCPSVVRDTLAKVLFWYYEVSSIAFVPLHLVCLMTLGINTGLVIDIGYKEASVIPVYEGVPILSAWQSLPVASKAVLESLNSLLLERAMCLQVDGTEKRVSQVMAELPERVLEDIKVRVCFVSTMERSKQLQLNKHDRSQEPPPPPPSVEYPFDGEKIITIPGSIRELAAEILFEEDDDKLSLPSMILKSLFMCPIDTRLALAANIMIVGGGTLMPGLKHRLLSEIRSRMHQEPYHKIKIDAFKVHSPPAKANYVAWLGASILGCTEGIVSRSLNRDVYLRSKVVPDWCNLNYTLSDDCREKHG